MASDPAGMATYVVRAEASRFRHPLLLVHGMWTGGWIWRDVGPYLAHRGWDAWVPSFTGDGRIAMDLHARRAALEALCRDLPASPIVVTHDAGLVVADVIGRDLGAPAVVAVAPVMGRPSLFTRPRFWAARIGARRVVPPVGSSAEAMLAGLTEADRAQLVADSGSFLRAVASVEVRGPWVAHGLVLAARGDAAAPLAGCERIAQARGWDVDVVETAGHFPMLGAVATGLGDRIHRWIVRALGHELLAWVDDEKGEE